ncbi:MAG: pyrophosphatase [Elusimicrobia bacterium RIFCSPLOWO2_02_FULL_39_32]|nr:MAG: pyrophosphatase [Elusimicrobia bacterium GWA2_38_7]OGR79912.1 MAG: pyrophosphatase [Elusimicrobia bacterium RIFCSPHIGHO2_02_FULL_39_36]OGR93447.1 MAG: pyrophosphatase [Elusimicrobia bacterium RIFCSPLOWO2_02_FULL_39_32]OGS00294.1 MAG: pyrophosphatase [Elusimicrobia bacterium RIFCSPLOWO2_12_FULL_39_28]
MNESNIILPALGIAEWNILWIVLGSAFVAILYGIYLCWNVLRQDPGSAKMQEVAKAIEEGAMAYLGQQFRMMSWIIIPLTIALFAMYRKIYAGDPSLEWIPLGVALSFLMGVLASYGAGFVGMWLAVKGNVRSANAALKSFKASMELAFRAGAVSGLFTVGFGLLGATIIFIIFREHATKVLVGFGFGGSLAALFMRVGGGIFTKAADVGGDLVGKVEVGIPEDDPRNAATIADNVGDNVGDCAGMAADVFESYEVTLVAAIILASATLLDPNFKATYGANASSFALMLIFFPLLLRAVGVFSSILGIWSVKVKEGSQMKDPMLPINIGYWVSSLSSVLGFAIVTFFYLKNPNTGLPDWRFFWATTIGIVLALLTLWITNYFTHPDKRPVMETATATKTGAATTILSGMAEGMESTVWAIVTIGATIISSGFIFRGDPALSAYGIALAGLGLLTTTGYILAMDTYGPITDNAHGIFEMSGIEQEKEAAKTLAWMDAIGNTTKALTKGLAIATAVLAAIALFRSFIDEAHLAEIGIQINMPKVFVGLLLGAAVPFLFSAFAIKAVGRAAFGVVEEVRRQFREHPGIMEGQEKPDYARCVSIVTGMAQKELLGPGILAIFSPILVAFSLGAAPLGGFLGGAIVTGQLLAVYMANAGANWDNAKKKIEDGYLGGKGTESHKAAVIGDTVGDPYKDTAGPALNPMIKVMNLVGILVAPFAIRDFAIQVRIMIVLVCASFLLLAVLFSRRGGLATLK